MRKQTENNDSVKFGGSSPENGTTSMVGRILKRVSFKPRITD